MSTCGGSPATEGRACMYAAVKEYSTYNRGSKSIVAGSACFFGRIFYLCFLGLPAPLTCVRTHLLHPSELVRAVPGVPWGVVPRHDTFCKETLLFLRRSLSAGYDYLCVPRPPLFFFLQHTLSPPTHFFFPCELGIVRLKNERWHARVPGCPVVDIFSIMEYLVDHLRPRTPSTPAPGRITSCCFGM